MVTQEQIQKLHADPESVEEFIEEACESGGGFDVDKAWHGLHFLLCGDTQAGEPPLNFILGGKPLGDVEVGYGPVCLFDVAETAAIAAALEPITRETLRKRFDADAFLQHDIYPGIWKEPVDECLDDYLLAYFGSLKDFVHKTRDEKAGMLVWLG